MADCKECKTPIDKARFRAEFCNDACRMRFTRREKALEQSKEINANIDQFSPNEITNVNPNNSNINPNNNSSNNSNNSNETTSMTTERENINEFLLMGRITELLASNADYKAQLQTAITEHKAQFQVATMEFKAEKKELEKEVKDLTKQYNELAVKYNTSETQHEHELNGFEQNKRGFGRELLDLIKDKDVMGNVIDAITVFKGENRTDNSQLAGAESEDMQAVKTIFASLGDEHQKMFVNSVYIYSKRPELSEKQALELEQIINGAGK